jgi:DNA polymerase-4/DNA polymerase V
MKIATVPSMPLSIRSFPRAIVHIDGDSFFASCEVAMNPSLRGKPVVTGRERGIASSMSYEARARGVRRAMSLPEIKKICPDVIILPSDYESYSLFSKRMYEIVRRYTPEIEEYSIDECFADLTGLRRSFHKSYEEIAKSIKHDLESELGITFSMGLAPNKVLAKVASKWNKPSGLTIIPAYKADEFLEQLSVDKIWGIGPQTTAMLTKHRIHTALAYAKQSEAWITTHMSKPYREIWQELRGEYIYPLNTEEHHAYQSISKTRTFTPPSTSRAFVFSQLSKNIENACIKARRHGLAPKKIFFFLKTQAFRYSGLELTASSPLSAPHEMIRLVNESFDKVFRQGTAYRATGIVLMDLSSQSLYQTDLFGTKAALESWKSIYAAIDLLDEKFGKHTVYLGASAHAMKEKQHQGARSEVSSRAHHLFKGETKRQHVGIPLLGEVK